MVTEDGVAKWFGNPPPLSEEQEQALKAANEWCWKYPDTDILADDGLPDAPELIEHYDGDSDPETPHEWVEHPEEDEGDGAAPAAPIP